MSEDLENGSLEQLAPASSDAQEVPEEAVEAAPQEEVKTPGQLLLEHIRDITAQSQVAALGAMLLHPPADLTREQVTELLADPLTDEALADVAFVPGKRDKYYYFKPYMTEHYAAYTAVPLAEKDVLETIAKTVRYNCKRYPRPTSYRQLKDSPYFFSEDVILGAAARMQLDERYQDIRTVTASNGCPCFYSSDIMSERYARSLAEMSEVERYAHQ